MAIDRERAIEIAYERALEKGWGFAEPVHVLERRSWFKRVPTTFEIITNYPNFGTICRFTIDAQTGAILEEGYVPW